MQAMLVILALLFQASILQASAPPSVAPEAAISLSDATVNYMAGSEFILQDSMAEIDLNSYYYSNFTPKNWTFEQFIDAVNQNPETLSRSYRGYMYRDDKLWLAFFVNNPASSSKDIVLELRYPANFATLYHVHDGRLKNKKALGVLVAAKQQDFPYRYPVFLNSVPPGRSIFILEMDTFAYQTPLFIWSPKAFNLFQLKDAIIITAIFSSFIIITFYNFLRFLVTRDKPTLYYVIYSSSFALYQSYIQGFGAEVLGFFLGKYLVYGYLLVTSVIYCGMIAFAISFLHFKAYNRIMYRVFQGLMVLSVFLGIPSLFSYSGRVWGSHVLSLMFVGSIPIIIYHSVSMIKRGQRSAIYYLASWISMGIGLTVYCLAMLSVIPANLFTTSFSLLLCALLEIVFISLAINYESNFVLQQKNALLNNAVEESKHAFEQMKKLVYPHQLNMIKEGATLEKTMPVSTSQACVISLDIVGSSKIKHIRSKDFFRNLFSRCNAFMYEGYDGSSFKANAYRIKEMGDGFLCSVGFPFQSLSNNPANDAVDLAKRFARVLWEEAQILHSETPITCGIGIALDTITGFYPESGTMEYDLHGPAIVLATRYESMRKSLFEADRERSVMIIQEVVYQSLDPSHRKDFKVIDLKEMKVVVRDDPAATKLYYQFLDQDQDSGRHHTDRALSRAS